jgi:hypothetical protein
MEDFMFWIIIIGLAIVIGNQTRQRQETEMKGMTKKEKDKYIKNIKKKQKENNKKAFTFLFWFIAGIIFLLITLWSL